MNMRFTFRVAAYPAFVKNPTESCEVMEVATTGSQETRARRRLLEHLHAHGIMAKSVELLATEEAKRG